EGYQFLGWYDNPSFDGSPITKIMTGSTGNKVYHAKFEELQTYSVTFNLGDYGYTGTKTKDDLWNDFATDYWTFYGQNNLAQKPTLANFKNKANFNTYGQVSSGTYAGQPWTIYSDS